MMCHRARDLITMEGCLDFKLLALGEWQRNEQGATMLTQVWEGCGPTRWFGGLDLRQRR